MGEMRAALALPMTDAIWSRPHLGMEMGMQRFSMLAAIVGALISLALGACQQGDDRPAWQVVTGQGRAF